MLFMLLFYDPIKLLPHHSTFSVEERKENQSGWILLSTLHPALGYTHRP